MTPAQKAHNTRVFAFARQVVSEIRQMQANGGCSAAEVVAIFTGGKTRGAIKADAFSVLDNEYSRFGSDTRWHAALRNCRNHPQHGADLFATWN